MKSFLRTLAVVLLVLCFSFAVGCKDKDYVADYSNEMPTLTSKVEGTESGSTASGEEQQGADNTMDVDDLLNPDGNNEEQSKNQSGSSSKTSTGSSSSSGSSSTTSSKPSSSSSKPSSSSSSQATGSSKPSSSGATSSLENEMATGSEKDTGSYDTPGWIM